MARISIWDMDFFYKKTFRPNYELMKISSYHKQRGDLINFITEESHIEMIYDKYYISREKNATPPAPTRITDRENVFLMGRGFRYHDNIFKINQVIAATRPDYNLYPPQKKGSLYNAEVVQFFFNKKLLLKKQPFFNRKMYHKKTLVIDKDFWSNDVKEIETALIELQNYKRIAFLHPIRLKILMNSDKLTNLFLNLHFTRETIFKWRNDFGSTFTEAKKIIDFYIELKKRNSSCYLGRLPFKTVTTDHWSKDARKNALYDLERCMKIVHYAKQGVARILMVAPKRAQYETPYWYYFDRIQVWTEHFERESFVEMMLFGAMMRWHKSWKEILQDPMKWDLPNTNFLLDMIANYSDIIFRYGLLRRGEDYIDFKDIDLTKIVKANRRLEEIEVKRKLMFADIETTGFSRDWDSIIEIAAIIVNEETWEEIDRFHSYIKPNKSIPKKITEITGINDEKVKNCESEEVVVGKFFEWVGFMKPDAVVGHNYTTFDGQFFSAKAKKYRYDDLDLEIIDTLKIAREKKIPVKTKTARGANSYTQISLASHYGVEYQAHSAIEDVRALIEIYKQMTSPTQSVKEARKELGF